ncbi:MAG: hypothetical protein WA921_07870 [Ahrensia sp.]
MQISENRAKQGIGGRRVLLILSVSLMMILGGYALVASNMQAVDTDLVGEEAGAAAAD